jgi:hypothetical protein
MFAICSPLFYSQENAHFAKRKEKEEEWETPLLPCHPDPFLPCDSELAPTPDPFSVVIPNGR